MRLLFCLLIAALPYAIHAAVLDQEVDIQGNFIKLGLNPVEGGAVHTFGLIATPGNLAGEGGLLNEGFGVGSYYVPNRRVNQKMEALEAIVDRPVLEFSYDCDGPNIAGLHSVRRMELLPEEASMRVTWTVENRGTERQWVTPWVRNMASPGGSTSPQDRWDFPAFQGILQADHTAWYPASRNWIAATDPIEEETWYAVFHADHTFAFLTLYDNESTDRGYQTAFTPFALEPGSAWTTTYRMNAVRGLKHVDFATEEFAAQIDYAEGKLTVLLSPVKPLPQLEIHARITAPNGRVWRLPAKRFEITPTRLARCTYDWTPPGEGAFEFIAQLRRGETPFEIGKETGSPHGGIDTQFRVGKSGPMKLEAWTDAPHALDVGIRTLKRTLLKSGKVSLWAESSLEKILPADKVVAVGPNDPVIRVALARNERESFQLVVHPSEGNTLRNVQVRIRDLTHPSGAKIGPEDIGIFNVAYQDIRIPSHFEGPTGQWPDALPPFENFIAPAGVSTPVWVTVHARADLPPGDYRGFVEMNALGSDPIEATLLVHVYGFALPTTPALKTDFGFWLDAAARGSKARGGNASAGSLVKAYMKDALAHRVTLRDLSGLPVEDANYRLKLGAYEPVLDSLLREGISTVSVPPSLLEVPEQLVEANAFIRKHSLQDRAFVHLSDEPQEPAWPRLLETMEQWRNLAPDIPVMVTTFGLHPFIPPTLDRWALHTQAFDTGNNREILNRISEGKEVWMYVNHTPPRPYANFFVDFAGIEHRILFWQAWALGIRGMHYWSINYLEPAQDPWQSVLDVTPVNGDGFLVYPGADGPVNSIRWEIIRDGIEDYDYLAQFMERRKRLLEKPGHEALLAQAAQVYDLQEIVPSLVTFTRDSGVLQKKRDEIARMIETMDAALK